MLFPLLMRYLVLCKIVCIKAALKIQLLFTYLSPSIKQAVDLSQEYSVKMFF